MQFSRICCNEKYFLSKPRLYYIPTFDLTAQLWQYHLRDKDCTHFLPGILDIHRPLVDAIFFAVAHDLRTKANRCDVNNPHYSLQQIRENCIKAIKYPTEYQFRPFQNVPYNGSIFSTAQENYILLTPKLPAS